MNNQLDWCSSTRSRVTFSKDGPSRLLVHQSWDEQKEHVSRDLKPYKIKIDDDSL